MITTLTTHTFLSFLLIFFAATSSQIAINDHEELESPIACPEIEKRALLSFKRSLKDPYDHLSSWNDEVSCCMWKGVVCSNSTGHVHELHLRGYYYNDEEGRRFEKHGLRGKIGPSLSNLKHLRYLDLSLNDFEETTIPSFIGSFVKMEHLNLSDAGFSGPIPRTIGNLSNLRALGLNSRSGGARSDSLDWLSGLSKLERLSMNYVNLSRVSNWLCVMNELPSLSELRLQGCSLDLSASVDSVNFSSLLALDLSRNYYGFGSVPFPRWISRVAGLTFLDLSGNFIEGPIPSTSNATDLEYINLSYNDLNSTIPGWLYSCNKLEFVYLMGNSLRGTISDDVSNLTSLTVLDLSGNKLDGNVPPGVWRSCEMRDLGLSSNALRGEMSDFLGNMSDCFSGSLELLELRTNRFSGRLSDRVGELKSLRVLDLGHNSISGVVPSVIGELSSLEFLRLNDNGFVGNLHESFGKLANLEEVDISYNSLEGSVTERHLIGLKKLSAFVASRNRRLSFEVGPDWVPPFDLSFLYLDSTGLNGPFPSWIRTQTNVRFLDLSDSGIHGLVPSWVWSIHWLKLSHNDLHGEIPNMNFLDGSFFRGVYLSSNRFSGPLPRIAGDVFELDLSNNSISGGISNVICNNDATESYGLEILHLGANRLSGELPNCWAKLSHLKVLNLGDNDMYGGIPSSIEALTKLQTLNLRNNRLSRDLSSLRLDSRELVKIDLSGNYFYGNLPKWAGSGYADSLRIIVLRSNELSGPLDSDVCSLSSLQILDVSNNSLSGTIPGCFRNFTAMTQKPIISNGTNYSYSRRYGSFIESVVIMAKGHNRQYDVILPLVTMIDLSNNDLSGNIPLELTRLVSLRLLNLSRNHLTGSIPSGIGDMRRLESLDLSLNSLTGELPRSFAVMSALSYLNLSYNDFTGNIPESTQLQSMDASCFAGNKLCGPPLTASKCGVRNDDDDDDDDDDGVVMHKVDVDWFMVLFSLGFTVGMSSFCVVTIRRKSFREAYFERLDDVLEKILLLKRSK